MTEPDDDDDLVSVASSCLSPSECEAILGPGFCADMSKAKPKKSLYFSAADSKKEPSAAPPQEPPLKTAPQETPHPEPLKTAPQETPHPEPLKTAPQETPQPEPLKMASQEPESVKAPHRSVQETQTEQFLAQVDYQPPKSRSVAVHRPQFAAAETQTAPVATRTRATDSSLDCRCKKCKCAPCSPPDCPPSDSESSDTPPPARPAPHRRPCKCCAYSDESSDESAYTTDFMNLSYQNNEEYLQLLCELERKLIARNRERVRRRRQEFENKCTESSRYCGPPNARSHGDDYAFCKRKSPRHKKYSGRRAPNSDILQNERKWEQCNFIDSFARKGGCGGGAAVERSINKSHWQMDARSGEWVKVSDFEARDYGKEERSPRLKECPCCRKKRYR